MLSALAVAVAISAPAPASFPSTPGWDTGAVRLAHAGCPRCVQTESWASSVRYRDLPNQIPPHRTMAVLPPNGVIVRLTRAWQPKVLAWMLRRRPLTIDRRRIVTNFEGNTTRGRVSMWGSSTWRAGSHVTVWVFFGSPAPSGWTVARAQRMLDATRFPVWRLRP